MALGGLAVVSGEALPYLLLLLLLEVTAGGMALLVGLEGRRLVVPSYVKLCALLLAVLGGLSWAISLALPQDGAVGGYPLELAPLGAMRGSLAALFALGALYSLAALGGRRHAAAVLGPGAAVAGLLALALLAWLLSQPAFSYATLFLSLLLGSLSAGGALLAMIWGHWYLVTPRLPTQPLSLMTFFLFTALALQGLLLAAHALLPVRQVPAPVELVASPLFWLRVGPALLFALALSFRAWQLSFQRTTIQEATGLLYLAVGAVLGGEVLGRALLFVTAAPV